jgi:hypothetical protein
MSETLSDDVLSLNGLSQASGEEQLAIAVPEPQAATITAADAVPADEVVHVGLSAASMEPQIEALPLSGAAAGAYAPPEAIAAEDLTAVAAPDARFVEEAASLPSIDALGVDTLDAQFDAQFDVAPLFEAVAVTEVDDQPSEVTAASMTIAADDASVETVNTLHTPDALVADVETLSVSAAAAPLASEEIAAQLLPESAAAPVAEIMGVEVEQAADGQPILAQSFVAELIPEVVPVATSEVIAAPQAISADVVPVVSSAAAAPDPSASRTSSSTVRFLLIALAVLLLLAAVVVAVMMLNGVDPLAQFGL